MSLIFLSILHGCNIKLAPIPMAPIADRNYNGSLTYSPSKGADKCPNLPTVLHNPITTGVANSSNYVLMTTNTEIKIDCPSPDIKAIKMYFAIWCGMV